MSAVDYMCIVIQVLKSYKDAGLNAFGDTPAQQSGVDVQAFVMRLFTADPATLADELSNTPFTYPCLVMLCGSATVGAIVSVLIAICFSS
jgi:hypothetical protein